MLTNITGASELLSRSMILYAITSTEAGTSNENVTLFPQSFPGSAKSFDLKHALTNLESNQCEKK